MPFATGSCGYTHRFAKYVVDLLREIISNAIHAVLIRESKEKDYVPELNLNVVFDEIQCKIELTDNGEGFNEKNRKYFEELDKKNSEKEKLNFHPLGQGRLAIVYFALKNDENMFRIGWALCLPLVSIT